MQEILIRSSALNVHWMWLQSRGWVKVEDRCFGVKKLIGDPTMPGAWKYAHDIFDALEIEMLKELEGK